LESVYKHRRTAAWLNLVVWLKLAIVGRPDDERSASNTINPFASEAMKSRSPEKVSRVDFLFAIGVLI
jgi:hypothetical protein